MITLFCRQISINYINGKRKSIFLLGYRVCIAPNYSWLQMENCFLSWANKCDRINLKKGDLRGSWKIISKVFVSIVNLWLENRWKCKCFASNWCFPFAMLSKSMFLPLHQHIDVHWKWSLWKDCRQKSKKHTYVSVHCPWESMLNGLRCCDSIRNDKHIRCSRAIRDDVRVLDVLCLNVMKNVALCARSRAQHTHNGSVGTVWACRLDFYVTHRRKTCV